MVDTTMWFHYGEEQEIYIGLMNENEKKKYEIVFVCKLECPKKSITFA